MTAAAINVNGSRGSASYTTTATDTAATVASEINKLTPSTGVTATARTDVNLALGAESYQFDLKGDNSTAVTISFSVGGTASSATDYAAGINAINAQSSKTGVTAQYDNVNGGLKLTHTTGADIDIKNTVAAGNAKLDVSTYKVNNSLTAAFDAKANAATALSHGRVTYDSEGSFAVTDASALASGAAASTLKSVASLDVTTFDNAQLAIKIADAALASVNSKRAEYGALQSLFSSAISNLQSTTENLSASRSRIVDTDFAAETANMTRGQILQQAGTAMLAQANSLPNGVLSLLRG